MTSESIASQARPSSGRKPTQLSRQQQWHVTLMQLLFFILGLVFLISGLLRIFIAQSGGALQTTAEKVVGEELLTTPTLIFGVFLALLGYGLLWSFAALGAKEPPAWQAGRNGLVGIILALTAMAIYLFVEDSVYKWRMIGAWLVIGALSAYLLTQFSQLPYRLTLGAERLRTREIKIFTARNVVLVLIASSLTVLGVVYAVLTDIIELPLEEAQPGEFLFITDFENYNDEWDIYEGRNSAQIVEDENGNHRLVITADSGLTGDGVFSPINRKFRDFDLRVTAQQLESDPVYDNRYGVIFRERDTNHYYAFEISGDGYYRLYKLRPATDKEISQGSGEYTVDEISTWIPTTESSDESLEPANPTLIRPGSDNSITNPLDAINEIRIIAKGDKFWFYVNGQHLKLCEKGESAYSTYYNDECLSGDLVDYYQDDDYKQGYIALSAGYTGNSDTTYSVSIAFDNLVIMGPAEPIIDAE